MIPLRCLLGFGRFHELESKGLVFQGVTLGWGGQPVRGYSEKFMCIHCGQHVTGDLVVIHGERKLWPHLYCEDGWPKDDEGNRAELEIINQRAAH